MTKFGHKNEPLNWKNINYLIKTKQKIEAVEF